MSKRGPHCPADWEKAYVDGVVPWDLRRAPPVLEQLLATLQPAPGGERVFVPGAGRGHDARAWARAGFEVTANDISPTAVAEGRALDAAAGVALTWLEGDLFDLPAALHGSFDHVWEQTCFCAFDPSRRDDYVDVVASLLRPGGSWLGVLWDVGRPGGPPYSVTRADVTRHFARHFEIVAISEVPAWSKERWDEILVELVRS